MAIGDVKTVILSGTTQEYSPAAGVNELIVGGLLSNISTGSINIEMKQGSNTTWRPVMSVSSSNDIGNFQQGYRAGAHLDGILAGIMLTPDTTIRKDSSGISVLLLLTVREVQAGA